MSSTGAVKQQVAGKGRLADTCDVADRSGPLKTRNRVTATGRDWDHRARHRRAERRDRP